jgi:hypothetical protein
LGQSQEEGMKKIGVYAFRNVLNGKWYVGQSHDTVLRRREHVRALLKGIHTNVQWQKDFSKSGDEAFEYWVLSELPITLWRSELKEWLNTTEKLWIAALDSASGALGYNRTCGGSSGNVVSIYTRIYRKLCVKQKRKTGKAYWKKHWGSFRGLNTLGQ